MPSKSRRHRSKKRQSRRSPPTIVAQQPAISQTDRPVASSREVVASAGVPAPAPTLTVVRYPNILSELRRVGILAGIMLAILVVLALVLA